MIALAILRRLLVALVTLAGVAIVVFVLLRVVPGDPVAMMISPGASPADIAALRAHYGLDGSLFSQFAVWVRYALRGDFGTSISLHRDVLALLGERLPATLELATAALEFAVIVGGAVAILAQWRGGHGRSRSSMRSTGSCSPFPISSGRSRLCLCSESYGRFCR